MKIQEYLSENRANLIDRTLALKWAWKDIKEMISCACEDLL